MKILNTNANKIGNIEKIVYINYIPDNFGRIYYINTLAIYYSKNNKYIDCDYVYQFQIDGLSLGGSRENSLHRKLRKIIKLKLAIDNIFKDKKLFIKEIINEFDKKFKIEADNRYIEE